MKQLMATGEYTKRVSGCAYIRKDWKNHKNHQHEWWWDRQVNAVAKVVNTETYFIEGVTKPKTDPRSMNFTLYGYNTCGLPAWTQGFSFVIVGDPYPIYEADGDEGNI